MHIYRRAFIIWCLMASVTALAPAWAESGPSPQTSSTSTLRRAAVATFLVGPRQPEIDESMDQTLSCPIGEICMDDPSILPHAGATLTRLVDRYLRGRFGQQIVSRTEMRNAETEIQLNQETDTPRTLAERLGRLLEVDVVVIGTVWRYRDRGAIEGVPDSPASVAFAVYFIDASNGHMLWRGLYDGTQRTVSKDLLHAGKQLKMGLKWLTADELAAHGVRECFSALPPTLLSLADLNPPN